MIEGMANDTHFINYSYRLLYWNFSELGILTLPVGDFKLVMLWFLLSMLWSSISKWFSISLSSTSFCFRNCYLLVYLPLKIMFCWLDVPFVTRSSLFWNIFCLVLAKVLALDLILFPIPDDLMLLKSFFLNVSNCLLLSLLINSSLSSSLSLRTIESSLG